MRVKTFRGKTMAETLKQVKRQFGPHAVILHTRTATQGGLLGVGGKPCVEITAARQMSDLPEPLRRGTLQVKSSQDGCADGAARPMSSSTKLVASPLSDTVLSELGALRSVVDDLVRETRRSQAADMPGELYEMYLKLVENAVAEQLARQLIAELRRELTEDQLHDPEIVRARLARIVESMVPTAGPIRALRLDKPTVIALIGPTGVGKTTTIAKLAANLCLREHRKVGLITIDTYRIAAVEQLKTYAQIIDVPLEVVMEPKELGDAVAGMADRDMILIDTAGRSQRDGCKIKELGEFFDVVRPDEVHLVLSSTSSETVLREAIQQFRKLGVNRVIFTKLDEAIGFGVILDCLQKAEAQLSYVTTGQDVPDDIQVGEGKALVGLILGTRCPRRDGIPAALSKGVPT